MHLFAVDYSRVILLRVWQAQLLKALKDMSDVEENDLDVTPVRDSDFTGTQYSCVDSGYFVLYRVPTV